MPLALTQTMKDVVVLRATPPPTMRFLALHAHRTLPGRAPAPLAAFQDDTDYYALRFEGVERLYGPGTLANLAGSHVCVVGLGGVGSWAVEALARSGVGSLTLMDPDEVCISNTNRQTNALRGTVGRSKAKVLAEQLGRKRGPPRFGHSSAEQAAPAPERVPGADEARPAWANQPLGPYNNAGQPHRSHRACFRPRRSVWRRSTQIAACTCARSGSRWTRATPCSPARRPPQRRHGKLRAAPARRVALPCSTQLTPTLRSTSYAPTPAPTQLQPSSRPAPAQLPPSSHPAPTQLQPSSHPSPPRCAITEACIRLGVHVAVAGASGGRADPSCVRVSDLTCTSRDPLLAAVRRSLRTEHGFPLGPPGGTRAPPPWGVPAVYSIEEVVQPLPQPADLTASGSFSNCEARFGTAGFVTGSFGLACASVLTKLVCHTGLEPRASRPRAALLR